MKKADLEKLKGLKVNQAIANTATPGRFGRDAVVPNRREQRRLDAAQGLVPFAVKLNADLVQEIHTLARERGAPVNDVVAELLKKALAG
jgi:hypothetical protein